MFAVTQKAGTEGGEVWLSNCACSAQVQIFLQYPTRKVAVA